MIRLTPAATIATTVLADAADAPIVTAADLTTVKVAKMMMWGALEAIASEASEKISMAVARVVATAAATARLVMKIGAATTTRAPATAKEVSAG